MSQFLTPITADYLTVEMNSVKQYPVVTNLKEFLPLQTGSILSKMNRKENPNLTQYGDESY